ncbi:Uncharacterized protein dnm_018540 [Desulfonema magnum]|uniref:Uncharacterized protein n=1 Tax=Desulfonema magnum TaxID=45655 RepID=A0A975BIN5_9BACT|nr:Uncharacterized protein dnm_018540 [Desulfonema magnum]
MSERNRIFSKNPISPHDKLYVKSSVWLVKFYLIKEIIRL